ncbi:hypothetical protein [Rhodococcus opacus]|uniref:hypothetical protein n=1 Tax=Rhodococcus opacus TaxID=37919 RepID=UPI00031FBAD1
MLFLRLLVLVLVTRIGLRFVLGRFLVVLGLVGFDNLAIPDLSAPPSISSGWRTDWVMT